MDKCIVNPEVSAVDSTVCKLHIFFHHCLSEAEKLYMEKLLYS